MARKIIIDTDPGVDDILAILLALSALPEELEVLLLSVTYGNIDVQNCLRNIVSLFHHVEKEMAWRRAQGLEAGFKALQNCKPLVAVGPEHPLADQILMADFFHGRDGLGGIHETHPHMTPAETWKHLFQEAEKSTNPEQHAIAEEMQNTDALFIPSRVPSSKEILRLLRENDPDTITIVAIGPLTNLALAASLDPETFLRVREVVVMGGSLNEGGNVGPPPPSLSKRAISIKEPPFRLIKQPPGPLRDMLNLRNQITPVAEFNTFADAVAAARVYALSSPNPHSTMPPTAPAPPGIQPDHPPPSFLQPYPSKLSRQLKCTLFPLDITHLHLLRRGEFRETLQPLLAQNSPLAAWVNAFMTSTFDKVESLQKDCSGDAVYLQLHDPLCIWYCMSLDSSEWKLVEDEDLRVETSGQWTRGMCIVDRRMRKDREDDADGEVPGDTGNWLSKKNGNRLRRCVGSPGEDLFGGLLLKRIFSL